MERTLIAVFDNRGDAQSALDALVAAGFSRQQVYLSDGDPTGAPGAVGATTANSDGSIVGSIRHFLSNLFGTDNSEHVQKYSDAVTRGHQVLTLRVTYEREMARAADIIERWGPVDIDEKSAQWGTGTADIGAMRMGSGAQQAPSMSQQSMQGAAGSAQGPAADTAAGQAQPGSQQRAAGTEGVGGASIPVTERSGVRVFEHLAEPPMDAAAASSVPTASDDAYFRSHYNSTYADGEQYGEQYDDYAPAYQYGAQMASHAQYRGRPWTEVEPQLRNAWEQNHPGSAWSRFKAAVRHGWEKLAS